MTCGYRVFICWFFSVQIISDLFASDNNNNNQAPFDSNNFLAGSVSVDKRLERLEVSAHYLSKSMQLLGMQYISAVEEIEGLKNIIRKQEKIIKNLRIDLESHAHSYYLSTTHGGLGPKTVTSLAYGLQKTKTGTSVVKKQ